MKPKNSLLAKLPAVLFDLLTDKYAAPCSGAFTPLSPQLETELLHISLELARAESADEWSHLERLRRARAERMPRSFTPAHSGVQSDAPALLAPYGCPRQSSGLWPPRRPCHPLPS